MANAVTRCRVEYETLNWLRPVNLYRIRKSGFNNRVDTIVLDLKAGPIPFGVIFWISKIFTLGSRE